MADSMAPQMAQAAPGDVPGTTKRDFLMLTTAAFAAVGVGGIVWPFVSSMAPARDVLALASTEVDISPIAAGQSVTVMWRGKPVFVRNRTEEEVREARSVPMSELKDPATDESRVKRDNWLVVVGVCTHLGCVPLGQKPTDAKGDYNGWFCPCHGSHYDTSARIRRGPAPSNLLVPDYAFTSDTMIRIG
ncbi:ubiquinol-cytochrome c reductase iron-sulfur subunit [Sabulicella glaciei]|uniref:Ubiquinol-cytochrome c reductase iron-sulfur subunit n=1 Tax=Sabulicella glaciei TaxID=2984948 RepID=A0ABT3NR25_9PROT|nr:ubiquinol-cytochrome c reductase iron-sulfur subunit [Roseococcus sp. MDT2-1-1]MCW8084611.1 ubiquinol-cytochrome c reductase iron-sulfur subunit [Roseococcus sp. MDT2-1-1]